MCETRASKLWEDLVEVKDEVICRPDAAGKKTNIAGQGSEAFFPILPPLHTPHPFNLNLSSAEKSREEGVG